jgi:hypothetical protein
MDANDQLWEELSRAVVVSRPFRDLSGLPVQVLERAAFETRIDVRLHPGSPRIRLVLAVILRQLYEVLPSAERSDALRLEGTEAFLEYRRLSAAPPSGADEPEERTSRLLAAAIWRGAARPQTSL